MKKEEAFKSYIQSRNWDGMHKILCCMNSSALKQMEEYTRSSVLPYLDNDLFWETCLHLIIYRRQAFLSTVKRCEHLVRNKTLNFNNPGVKGLAEFLSTSNPASITKIAKMLIPLLNTEELITGMFDAFNINNEITRISLLLTVDSPLSYYLIFKDLKMMDDKALAYKCSLSIIKRNNDMAFNAASILKTYFALDELPTRFSLNIEAYELSRIDRDFATFAHILEGKRPKI